MASLIVLEDDEDIREELADFLAYCGHQVRSASRLADFWPLMAEADIAILDIGLPDGDGYAAASRLRQASPRVGIIILTGRSALDDKLRGLDDGADHFLVKPFQLPELAAIVAALLRRVGRSWRLDSQTQRLIDPDGRQLDLKPFEMLLFERLAVAGSATLSRQELVTAMGYRWEDFDLRRLDTAICRLRSRWQSVTGEPLPLKTRHRHGYSFGVPIRCV